MGKPDFCFCKSTKGMTNQLRQKLLSWSAHVESWADATELNRLVVRYEDMRNDPLATFTRTCRFLQLPDDEASVQAALDKCAFDKLQAQEQEKGFCEKSPKHEAFFRKGIVGDWQQTLTPEQIDRIVADHHVVMRRFGYLDASGNPVAALPLEHVA